MIEQFDGKNIDGLMKIWRDNNLRFQGFVDKQYWIERYVETRDEFLKNKIYVYTEMGKVLAFIVFGENGTVLNIQVRPEIQREGIGKLLIDTAKSKNENLSVCVYEENDGAVLFFRAMGFSKVDEYMDECLDRKAYRMKWDNGNDSDVTFIYFDNSISQNLIEKYDSISHAQFYNVHTCTEDGGGMYNVNIVNGISKIDGRTVISDYVEVRNKLNAIMKNKKVVIYFDCNNDYCYIYDVIKDIVKVRNLNLKVVLHKPFSVEGSKKLKMYEEVKSCFGDYNVMDVDYEAIGENKNVTFKDAFDMRDEELLKMVCKLCEN